MNKLVLIDGHSILNRAFYGVPLLTNAEGLHTNGIYGFLNIMFKIIDEENPDYMVVAFDRKEPTFRHLRYKEYKGTRKPMPQELREQVPVIKELLRAMHVSVAELAGAEADDILGTLAKQAESQGMDVSIVSGDRDLLQLATNRIQIRIPKTKGGQTEIENYYDKDVEERYGLKPLQIIDLKGLMGDSADNIPGIPGVGEKRATAILQAFETVENAYVHVDEVTPASAQKSLRENYDKALLSKELATIKLDVEVPVTIEESGVPEFFTEEAFPFFKRLEFKNYLMKFSSDVTSNKDVENGFEIVKDAKTWNAKNFSSWREDVCKGQFSRFSFVLFPKKEASVKEDTDGQLSFFGAKSRKLYGASFTYGNSNQDCKTVIVINENDLEDYDITSFLEEVIDTESADKCTLLTLDLKSQLGYLKDEHRQIEDLGIMAYVCNPIADNYRYDAIGNAYTQISIPSKSELFGKKKEEEIFANDVLLWAKYAGYHSYTAFAAYEELKEQLQQTKMEKLYYDIELPLVYTLFDMQKRGICANRQALSEYSESLVGRINELEENIYKLAGEEFNINSPKQLGVILFEKLRLPFAKKTKTGYSTSADILEKLRNEDPIVGQILEYRQLTKLNSTYAQGLSNYIDASDQRIHGQFHQTVTATGRISSTEPNLQNIPIRMELGRQIRKVFVPQKDYVFLDADYSQIELRILAHLSGDEKLIEAYNAHEDIHRITASQVFNTPIEQVTDLQRRNAKAVNFGIIYGISSFGLGQDLNISRKEAENYIKQYFASFPKIKGYLDGLVEKAKQKGYSVTMFGRRRPIPEMSSSNFMQRQFGERIAMNSPIQGTAADIIKIAMIRVNERLKKENFRSRLLLQIHDELLIETHKDEIEKVREILVGEMKNAADLKVSLEVEVNQGNNWYEAK
ncbi:MAG: DNA polymerase I [Lachnospiraceae bacterium]|nr:DNA polymerase I [Lachnospiraceae bacterium]